ncbi:MAG TPA: hypothetical protein VKR53_11385 [Puia sp.]|nr:hypothetical protein [Puia sp.]
MKFERQIQFSTTIKSNGQMREFNFLKIKNASIPTYHVDVSDERGNRHYFSLIYENTKWVIGKSTLPSWIMNAENDLATAVSDYESVG